MRSLSIVLVLALCATAQAQPPTTKAEPQAPVSKADELASTEVAKWMAFFDKLVDAVALNANSCDKMAGDVAALIEKNGDALTLARTARAQHKKLPLAAQQHMMDGVKKMMPGMQNCGDNEKVQAAFARLDIGGHQQ